MSSSSEGGEFVAGTPVKARPPLSAQPQPQPLPGGGRFARGPPLAQPATVRAALAAPTAACILTRPAVQRDAPPAARAAASVGPARATPLAPVVSRFSAPSVAEPPSHLVGQGSSLLQRGAGGFSRIAQEREKAHGAQPQTLPPYRSQPSIPAAAAPTAAVHAPVVAPPPRAEARYAHCWRTACRPDAPLPLQFCCCHGGLRCDRRSVAVRSGEAACDRRRSRRGKASEASTLCTWRSRTSQRASRRKHARQLRAPAAGQSRSPQRRRRP